MQWYIAITSSLSTLGPNLSLWIYIISWLSLSEGVLQRFVYMMPEPYHYLAVLMFSWYISGLTRDFNLIYLCPDPCNHYGCHRAACLRRTLGPFGAGHVGVPAFFCTLYHWTSVPLPAWLRGAVGGLMEACCSNFVPIHANIMLVKELRTSWRHWGIVWSSPVL